MTDEERIARLKTPEECEQLALNAIERGRQELAKLARRRAVELRAHRHGANTEVEREALQAIHAFEEVRSQETGRRARASRTWQSIARVGIVATVEKVVARKDETDGYQALVDAGMSDFTFEAVVTRHPDAFSIEAVQRAKSRLASRLT